LSRSRAANCTSLDLLSRLRVQAPYCPCDVRVAHRYIFHLLSDGRTVSDIQLTKAGSSVITSCVRDPPSMFYWCVCVRAR
jgi:hypothetical protein